MLPTPTLSIWRNHYETLGVEVFVDPKIVKRAYRKVRRARALLSASLERFLSFCLLFPADLLFVLFCVIPLFCVVI